MKLESQLERILAFSYGGKTAAEFQLTNNAEGWVVLLDTKNKRFIKKHSKDAHGYWRNFLYIFDAGKNGTRRSTVAKALQEAAAQAPKAYWVPVFYISEPKAAVFTKTGYREVGVAHKGFRIASENADVFEYKHKATGMSYFISVAQNVSQADVWRRLKVRIDALVSDDDLAGASRQNVRNLVRQDVVAFSASVNARAMDDFEVVNRVDLKISLSRDKSSGSTLVKNLNTGAVAQAAKRHSQQPIAI